MTPLPNVEIQAYPARKSIDLTQSGLLHYEHCLDATRAGEDLFFINLFL
jgi:hypothetical protein